MDSDAMVMLHIFMLFHLRKMRMNQTAEIFATEAGITDLPPGFNVPDGFLGDWWCIFWDFFNASYNTSNVVQPVGESSTQAEARAYAQAQFQTRANVDAHAYTGQAQGQGQAQTQTQTQTWPMANNEMGFYNPYVPTIGQTSMQPFVLNGYNANMSMMSQPIFAPGLNDNVQQGLVSSDPSMHNLNTAPVSRPSRRRASRPRNRTQRSISSNSTSQGGTNPVTITPCSQNPLDLNAFLGDFDLR